MNRDLIRSLAKAIGGRLRSFLTQAAREEAARAIRHFRARMQGNRQPAGASPAARLPSSAPSTAAATAPSSPGPDVAEPGPAALASAAPRDAPAAAPEERQPEPKKPASRPDVVAKPSPKRSVSRQGDEPEEGILNINAASKDELIALPGIGEARADAIIKARPFAAASDLVEKKVLPASVFEGLKDRIGVA